MHKFYAQLLAKAIFGVCYDFSQNAVLKEQHTPTYPQLQLTNKNLRFAKFVAQIRLVTAKFINFAG